MPQIRSERRVTAKCPLEAALRLPEKEGDATRDEDDGHDEREVPGTVAARRCARPLPVSGRLVRDGLPDLRRRRPSGLGLALQPRDPLLLLALRDRGAPLATFCLLGRLRAA